MTAAQAPDNTNPFDALIDANAADAALISAAYEQHRTNRNKRNADLMLDSTFEGMVPDTVLSGLLANPSVPDVRNGLSIWARPPKHICGLVKNLQDRLAALAPNIWIVPGSYLHLTVLEIAHSRTPEEIASLVEVLRPHFGRIKDCLAGQSSRLVHPQLSFDAGAIALSFVPDVSASYTHHHLRRDVSEAVRKSRTPLKARYVVPTAHITVARFVSISDFGRDGQPTDLARVAKWIRTIEEINRELKSEVWSQPSSSWEIGPESLTAFFGTNWYGHAEGSFN
ncbi:RNA ligase/cyclic nucleotide phosphodiesterase [Fimicolochytrium jonesii]|uniref:RNA ligase/cyclic nucleotide phosphodiesterase n=1 Tax=Fimicolochytrium jonesii TaxID=1396493 RepID=UPI0022FDEF7E|nr:RNA ligase/cyclic nucleotide phosphodiesterase [Fimicolochytrium jonesii]KAI8821658.1 RNA ligase/cyclic nucleotide phosphodiesterase [Fimicolochytrium jonesii]